MDQNTNFNKTIIDILIKAIKHLPDSFLTQLKLIKNKNLKTKLKLEINTLNNL